MRLGPSQQECLGMLEAVVRQESVARFGIYLLAGRRGTGKTTVLKKVATQAGLPVITGLDILKANIAELSSPVDFSGARFSHLITTYIRHTTTDEKAAVLVDTLPILALLGGSWEQRRTSPSDNIRDFLWSLAREYTKNKPILIELGLSTSITLGLLREFVVTKRLASLKFGDRDSRQAYWAFQLQGSGHKVDEFVDYYQIKAANMTVGG